MRFYKTLPNSLNWLHRPAERSFALPIAVTSVDTRTLVNGAFELWIFPYRTLDSYMYMYRIGAPTPIRYRTLGTPGMTGAIRCNSIISAVCVCAESTGKALSSLINPPRKVVLYIRCYLGTATNTICLISA